MSIRVAVIGGGQNCEHEVSLASAASAVAALDAIEQHYARHGATVEITGLDERSAELHETLSGQPEGAR